MRQILIIIYIIWASQLLGQTSKTIRHFEPVSFKQNSDTIEGKYFSRLDSLGNYLQSDTTLSLQFYSNIKDAENLNTYFDLHISRARNILIYLTSKHKFKTNGVLFAEQSSILQSEIDNKTKEKPRFINFEFIIK